MMKALVLSLPAVLLACFLSGCAGPAGGGPQAHGGGTGALTTPAYTSAAPATVGETTGSVTGLVLDDEHLPVYRATVALSQNATTTTTDGSGRYTLNEMAPGAYTLFASAVGFQSAGKKVEVKAGAVTYANFSLSAVPVSVEGHYTIVPKVFLIHLDHDYIGQVESIANQNVSAISSYRCEPCDYVIAFEPKPVQVVTEGTFLAGSTPATNQDAYIGYYTGFTDTTYGKQIQWAPLKIRSTVNWTAAALTSLKGLTKVQEHIFGGFTSVSVELKVNSWTTFAYGSLLGENFTALPPE